MYLIELSSLLVIFGKSEVSYFIGLVFNEYISGFEISVNNGVLMQIPISPNKLLHDDNTL